jgi:hypothetical protein
MLASRVAEPKAVVRRRCTGLRFCGEVASRNPAGGSHDREEQRFDVARPNLVVRTAERYWLLRFDDDELRFTLRTGAELWAAKLAAHGIASQLTWHDETTPAASDEERAVL